MGLSVYTGSFTVPNFGVLTSVITGVGFQPKVVVFYGLDASAWGPNKYAIGFDDGTTHLGMAFNSGDFNGAFSQSEEMWSDQFSICRTANAASELITQRLRGYISAFSGDGFTITWDQTISFGTDNDHARYGFMAIGGSSVSASVQKLQPNGLSTQVVTGLGFTPTSLLTFYSPGSSGSLAQSISEAGWLGVASACGIASAAAHGDDGAGANPSVTYSQQVQDSCFFAGLSGGGMGHIASWDADGVTVTWTTPTSAVYFPCLLLGGIAANVGVFAQRTSTGSQVVSISATNPKGLIVFSDNKPAHATSSGDFLWMIGTGNLGGQNSFTGGNLTGKAAPTSATGGVDLTRLIAIEYPTGGNGPGTYLALATLTGLTSGSFTLNWTTVDNVARLFFYLVLAERGTGDVCGSAGPTEPVHLFKADSGGDDSGEVFLAYVKTRAIPPSGQVTRLGEIREPFITAKPSAATLQVITHRDFELESKQTTVSLAAAASEDHIIRKADNAAMADATVLQFQLGDATASSQQWSLDELHIPVIEEGDN